MREVRILAEVNDHLRREICHAAVKGERSALNRGEQRLFGLIAILHFDVNRALNSSSMVYPDGSMRDRFATLVKLYADIQRAVDTTYGEHSIVGAHAKPNKTGTHAAIIGSPKPGGATEEVLHTVEALASKHLAPEVLAGLKEQLVIIPIDHLLGRTTEDTTAESLGALCMRVNSVLWGERSNGVLPLQKPKVRERAVGISRYGHRAHTA